MSDLWEYDEEAPVSSGPSKVEGKTKKLKMYIEVESDDATSIPSPKSVTKKPALRGTKRKSSPSPEELSPSREKKAKVDALQENDEAKKQKDDLDAWVNEFDEFLEEAQRSALDEESGVDLCEDIDAAQAGTQESHQDATSDNKDEEDSSDQIILVCKDAKKNSAKVRIKLTDGFQSLFQRYNEHAISKGWVATGDTVKYCYDGEVVRPTDTPEGLECENLDSIDVHITTG